MFKFDLSYGEVVTINNALNMFLDKLKSDCESVGFPEMYKESVAYDLIFQFREVIDEVEDNKR